MEYLSATAAQSMETTTILQIASKIMHDLGAGYSESIYQNALHRKLARIDCTCVMEKIIPVVYEGDTLGTCRADIVMESHVIEIKAVRRMPPGGGAEKQVCKYVRHLFDLDGKARKGLVINFNQETEKIETLEPVVTITTLMNAKMPPQHVEGDDDTDNTELSIKHYYDNNRSRSGEGGGGEGESLSKRRKITPMSDDPF